jgi:hypothetical protein
VYSSNLIEKLIMPSVPTKIQSHKAVTLRRPTPSHPVIRKNQATTNPATAITALPYVPIDRPNNKIDI